MGVRPPDTLVSDYMILCKLCQTALVDFRPYDTGVRLPVTHTWQVCVADVASPNLPLGLPSQGDLPSLTMSPLLRGDPQSLYVNLLFI